MSKISTWSKTASSNNAAVPNGWPEGMNPSGVNDAAREMMAQIRTERESSQWFDFGLTPTYINASSFSFPTDETTEYHVGRRVKIIDSSTLYATILTSVYTTITTITLTMDSGSVSASISAVELAALSESNDTIPDKVVQKAKTQALTNKTIDSSLNTITNIVNADVKAGAAIDAAKIADGTVSNTEFQYINSLTSNAQTQINAKAPTASPTFTGTANFTNTTGAIVAGGTASSFTGVGISGSSYNNYGVRGTSTSSYGIYGTSTSSFGVRGASSSNYGVYGSSTSSFGVRGTSTSSYGIYGTSTSSYGIYGSCGSVNGIGQLLLAASSRYSGVPTHSAASGTFHVNANGSLYYNKTGSTTWVTIVA